MSGGSGQVTVNVDIGGTFTDCFVYDDGTLATGKAETTEYDLSVGFLNAIERAAESLSLDPEGLLSSASLVQYSTTVALNKLIAREGPRLGLLVTDGLEDTFLIGRGSQWADGLSVQEKRNVVGAEKPEPLIPDETIVGVEERIDADGEVVRPLDEDDLREKVSRLIDAGVRGFVVVLAWSFRNDTHEQRVREVITEEYPDSYLGSSPVFLSSEVSPKRGEYERTMTTVLNAYLHRSMVDELYSVGEKLRERGYDRPLMMIHNTGGSAEVFRTSAIDTFNGGPVASFVGSRYLGNEYGYDAVVAADMGGTSFDLSLITGGSTTREYDRDPVIDRWRVNTSMLETKSIGSGGGSIASINEDLDDRIEVGPESAGSNPGPACYNQGGNEPTVTDADLVLGYLNPENFHGGDKRLSERRARRAIQRRIADPLDIGVTEAASLIREITDGKMGSLIYKETALRGHNPEEFAVFAFGGAGPPHAASFARHAGIDTVVTFPYAPVFAAFGSSTMDAVHIYEYSTNIPLIEPQSLEYFTDYGAFNEVVRDLKERAYQDFEGEGHGRDDVEFALELDMKYGGQLDVTRVASPRLALESPEDIDAIADAFEQEYREMYSPISTYPESGIEVENFVLTATVEREKPDLPVYTDRTDTGEALTGHREVYWEEAGGFEETPIYARDRLGVGAEIAGPAVVEALNTTVVVPPYATFETDEHMTGIMTLEPDR